MSAKAGYFRIGLFVISSTLLGLGAMIVFGAGAVWKETVPMETYIDESVQGLAVGSPVKFRGVQIGKVESIDFVYNEYATGTEDPLFQSHGKLVVIRMALRPETFNDRDMHDVAPIIGEMVKNGLRVRLSSQGLTGVAYLEVDYLDPVRNPPMELKWTPRTYYVPSAPSTVSKLTTSAENVFNDLDEAEIGQLAKEVKNLVAELTRAIKDDVAPALKTINHLAEDLDPTLENLKVASEEFGPALKNVRAVTEDLGPAAKNIREATDELPETMERVSNVAVKLDDTMADISKNIDDLSVKLNRILDKLEGAVDGDLSPTLTNLHQASEDLPETLAALQKTLKRVDHLVAGEQENVGEVIASLKLISRDIQDLSGYAKKYPSHVLFGEPPPERKGK